LWWWCFFFLWCFFFSFFSTLSLFSVFSLFSFTSVYLTSTAFLSYGFSSFLATGFSSTFFDNSLALISSYQITVASWLWSFKAWDPSMFSEDNKKSNASVLVYFIL
jgi:hypothetical protein